MKYKVVCNRENCWSRTYDNYADAQKAAENHKYRLGHNPVYIYELQDNVQPTARELLAYQKPSPKEGIIQIKTV